MCALISNNINIKGTKCYYLVILVGVWQHGLFLVRVFKFKREVRALVFGGRFRFKKLPRFLKIHSCHICYLLSKLFVCSLNKYTQPILDK